MIRESLGLQVSGAAAVACPGPATAARYRGGPAIIDQTPAQAHTTRQLCNFYLNRVGLFLYPLNGVFHPVLIDKIIYIKIAQPSGLSLTPRLSQTEQLTIKDRPQVLHQFLLPFS